MAFDGMEIEVRRKSTSAIALSKSNIFNYSYRWGYNNSSFFGGNIFSAELTVETNNVSSLVVGAEYYLFRKTPANGSSTLPDDPDITSINYQQETLVLDKIEKTGDSRYSVSLTKKFGNLDKPVDWSLLSGITFPAEENAVFNAIAQDIGYTFHQTESGNASKISKLPKSSNMTYLQLVLEIARGHGQNIGRDGYLRSPLYSNTFTRTHSVPNTIIKDIVIADDAFKQIDGVKVGDSVYPSGATGNIVSVSPSPYRDNYNQAWTTYNQVRYATMNYKVKGSLIWDLYRETDSAYGTRFDTITGGYIENDGRVYSICNMSISPSGASFNSFDEFATNGSADSLAHDLYETQAELDALKEGTEGNYTVNGDLNVEGKVFSHGATFDGKVVAPYFSGLTEFSGRLTSPNIPHPDNNGYGHMRVDLSSSSMTEYRPASDGYIMSYFWDGPATNAWDSQFFIPDGSITETPQVRFRKNSPTWSSWRNFVMEGVQFGSTIRIVEFNTGDKSNVTITPGNSSGAIYGMAFWHNGNNPPTLCAFHSYADQYNVTGITTGVTASKNNTTKAITFTTGAWRSGWMLLTASTGASISYS